MNVISIVLIHRIVHQFDLLTFTDLRSLMHLIDALEWKRMILVNSLNASS